MGQDTFFLGRKSITALGVCILGVVGMVGSLIWDYSRNLEQAKEEFEAGQVPVVAEVLSEQYENNLSPVDKHAGFVSYSNPTVKLESKYTLKCRGEKGQIFGLSVLDGGSVTKESLDQLIEPGSRISFPRGNFESRSGMHNWEHPEETYFKDDTQAGSKRADRIRVLYAEKNL